MYTKKYNTWNMFIMKSCSTVWTQIFILKFLVTASLTLILKRTQERGAWRLVFYPKSDARSVGSLNKTTRNNLPKWKEKKINFNITILGQRWSWQLFPKPLKIQTTTDDINMNCWISQSTCMPSLWIINKFKTWSSNGVIMSLSREF